MTMSKKTAQLAERVRTKLYELPEEKIAEVLDFVEFLAERYAQPKEILVSKRGSREALLECIGIWAFEPGELDELLIKIEHGRQMELEEIGC
ncbi:MAG: DUF2281 domain-containing protein [Anaerolineales bacterium]|nr:MAG: DUF2281 domain-containing protein [Anaerolineales bacterium]